MSFARHLEFRAVSRWVGFGLIVGVLSGLAACLLYVGVEVVFHFVVHEWARMELLEPAGERGFFEDAPLSGPARPWILFLSPALGGCLSAWIAARFCAEARGGNEGWLRAFHQNRGRIRRRVAGVKLLASAINLGAGASGGREGPIAHIGAALGAWTGSVLKLNDRERRLLLLAGAAGGIGAIFRTPLGGALFVVEVLYKDDIEAEALVPAVLSSVVAYSLFTSIFGETRLFATPHGYDFDALELPIYFVMALCAGVVGLGFLSLHHKIDHWFKASSWSPPVTGLVGGLGVGALALVHPSALGAGYGWMQEALIPTGKMPVGWWGVGTFLLIVLIKVVATSLSAGSGAAGGIFGPSMVIGGMVGGAFGSAAHLLLPQVVEQPSAFMIVGMACFVGGVTSAPLSTLVMASEMTGSYELLVPTMLAEVTTYSILQRTRLYREQVRTRRESPAHAGEYVLDVLQDLKVAQIYGTREVVTVSRSMPLGQLLRLSASCDQAVFPVLDDNGAPSGLVSLETVRAFVYDEDVGRLALAADCETPFVSVTSADSLALTLERMVTGHYQELPVVDPWHPDRLLGLVSYDELLGAYSRELSARRRTNDAVSLV